MKKISLLFILILASSCKFLDKPFETIEIKKYKENFAQEAETNAGQVNFTMDGMGSLSLASLFKVNILPIKVYGTALLLMEEGLNAKKLDSHDLPFVMQKFGFIHPDKIANWKTDLSPEPKIASSLGFVHTQINEKILGKKVSIEVANITCAACHSGVTYDSEGNPKNEAWLGSANTSLNIDGFLNQIYSGLKKGMQDPKLFIKKIREAYPEMSDVEEITISQEIFPKIKSSLKNYSEMNRVLPFPNGGPGHTNGVAAFKRDAKILKDQFKFHSEEAGFVGLPNIIGKGFRSSLTIDGAYGVLGKERYRTITKEEANDPDHLDDLGELATFFTYSAMGTNINNIVPNIPKTQAIFKLFLKDAKAYPYPGKIDQAMALRGEAIFKQSCAQCHGDYSSGIENIEMLSFPNKKVAQEKMGTDPSRWMSIDQKVTDFTSSNVFSEHVDAGHSLGGYVAPILSGVWSKAPYLHNGSVPTLWQLMNPKLRATRFQIGGHALDLRNVGIRGAMNEDGVYTYPESYKPWSLPDIYDTRENGRSNKGHEKPFEKLSDDQKWNLIEYLKLL